MDNGISKRGQMRIEDKIRKLREKQVGEAVENIIEFDKITGGIQ